MSTRRSDHVVYGVLTGRSGRVASALVAPGESLAAWASRAEVVLVLANDTDNWHSVEMPSFVRDYPLRVMAGASTLLFVVMVAGGLLHVVLGSLLGAVWAVGAVGLTVRAALANVAHGFGRLAKESGKVAAAIVVPPLLLSSLLGLLFAFGEYGYYGLLDAGGFWFVLVLMYGAFPLSIWIIVVLAVAALGRWRGTLGAEDPSYP